MALIIRHGDSAHSMRPDRVYRTGVLSSMFGWNPHGDVQAVASSFTSGPPSGMGLGGLRGLGAAGPFQRFGFRIKSWFAANKARKFMAAGGTAGMPIAAPGGHGSGNRYGSAVHEARMIAPQIAQQFQMLAHLAPNAGGGPQVAAYEAATRRWNSYFRAG